MAAVLTLVISLAIISSPALAQSTVIRGAPILDHAIGKLALASMALQFGGKFEESLKLADREFNDYYAALPADRKTRMAATMKQAALPEPKFRENIQKLGVLMIEGGKATLTMKETVDVGGGIKTTSGLEQRFTLEGGMWKVAP